MPTFQRPRRLPAFLRFLSTSPNPGAVARALQEGPLNAVGATGTMLWIRTADEHLMAIAAVDVSGDVVERYGKVPLRIDLPITIACRAGSMTETDLEGMLDQYTLLSLDRDVWQAVRAATPGPAVCAAIMSAGQSVGLMSFIAGADKELTPLDWEIIDALRHALGLWLSRPDVQVVVAASQLTSAAPYVLTTRQREILLLIDQGLGNAEIGRRLGYSTSLVKQEVQRMTRGLRIERRADLVGRARELDML